MTSQRDRYVGWLLAHVGLRYCNEGPWRCTGTFDCYDCSGFAGAGLVAVGARGPLYCTNTNGMAAEIRAAGTQMSRAECERTPGAWAIRLGQGSVGHIVVSRGLIGGVPRTVEAASHASGIITGYFGNRHFDIYGRPPGLAGFDEPSAPVGTLKPGDNMAWKLEFSPRSTKAAPAYWMVDASGHVFAYGEADFYGGEGSTLPSGKKVDIPGTVDDFAVTPSGHGYAMVNDRGQLFAFGDASYAGDAYGDPHT